MRDKKIDDLFRRIVQEDAKEQSRRLKEERTEREAIPAESRARFEALLNEKLSKEQPAKRAKTTPWWTPRKIVAAAAMLFVAILMIPMTTEAGRRRITELISTVTSRYTEYRLSNQDKIVLENREFIIGYIPEGFVKTDDFSFNYGTTASYHYEKKDNPDIFFDFDVTSGEMAVDTEGATLERVMIGEEEGTLIMEDGYNMVVWSIDGWIFDLGGWIEKEEVLKMARSVK